MAVGSACRAATRLSIALRATKVCRQQQLDHQPLRSRVAKTGGCCTASCTQLQRFWSSKTYGCASLASQTGTAIRAQLLLNQPAFVLQFSSAKLKDSIWQVWMRNKLGASRRLPKMDIGAPTVDGTLLSH